MKKKPSAPPSPANTFLDNWWQNILWRERHHCNDKEYARHLSRLLRNAASEWNWQLQGRPLITAVEVALRQACRSSSKSQTILWANLLHRLTERKRQSNAPEQLVIDLQSEDWTVRFIARHILASLEGEVVNSLRMVPQEKAELVVNILKNIEIETTGKLAEQTQTYYCRYCLVHYREYKVFTSWQTSFTYYGCRNCSQSRHYFHCPRGLIAVLDNTWTENHRLQDGFLHVNWLVYKAVFDFEHIEIIQATDEQTERFAVQVGNDTDLFRKPRYEDMHCIIRSECELSKNTLRILKKMFGHVEQK